MLQQQADGSGGKDGEKGDGDGEGEGEGQVVPSGPYEELSDEELESQIDKLEKQIRDLEEKMANTADGLDKGLGDKLGDTRIDLSRGMDDAIEELNAQEDASMMFGEDPGALRHLDPAKRIQIAKSMESDKFRQIVKLLGKMVPRAMGEQCKKVERIPEEIVDIELGDDLSRILPLELVKFADPRQRVLALKRLRDKQMMQYKMVGVERLAQGDIIVCEDGSGSMYGAREIFAKALSITLAKIANEQGRAFAGIHFGSQSEVTTFEFENKGGAWAADSTVTRTTEGRYASQYPDMEMSYIEGIINFAELFYGGGTDFHTPLAKALSLLQAQHDKYGATRGDIVFISDGICSITPEFMKHFLAERERLDFRVWGMIIGASVMEPLTTICNADTFQLTDLTNGSEIDALFQRM